MAGKLALKLCSPGMPVPFLALCSRGEFQGLVHVSDPWCHHCLNEEKVMGRSQEAVPFVPGFHIHHTNDIEGQVVGAVLYAASLVSTH